MRASKLPYENFEYNIRRAEALARLDSYLKDLLYNEGKATIEPLFKIPNELIQALGIDDVMKRAFERMEESRKKDEKENINKGTSHRRANKL